ncbi:MAG: SCP2 sterol-binding domain-containing protein [Proteobacteria bacterium]|nr:SCP2 sterol-binding domain-containing protein [Pseudomonadota bacterium]MBU1696830.1 SCP2 sterol-binding domain-containing protein [Pseudomonadota bacterium]
MAVFESGEKFEKVLGGFFNLIADTPLVADKLLKSNLIVRFNYTDPDCVLLIDCSGDKVEVRPGDTETKAIVEMKMKVDIAHKFWYGKVNLTMALTRRQMVAKGPVPKILKLLPAIKPVYAMYPKYLDENGYSQYNIH